MDESRDDNEDSDEERQTLPVDIVTPDSHKAPVWTHFGFRKDTSTGRVVAGSKAICKICKKEVARSGGTTNLINHLCVHHRTEFEVLSGTDTSGAGQPKIVEFCPLSHKTSINKLGAGSKRAQELTGAIYAQFALLIARVSFTSWKLQNPGM